MHLFVFDMDFNRLGIIDVFEEINISTYFQDHSNFIVRIDANPLHADLFLKGEDRIIVKSTDIYRGYFIETPIYTDEKSEYIELIGRSLSVMTAWRLIVGQQRFVGNIADAIYHFINLNAVNPSNKNRIIPNLVLGISDGIDIQVDETYTNFPLDVAIWELCKKYDIGFEILMNHKQKKYVAVVYQGVDRSANQNINPHIIFSKAFGNTLRQSYTDDQADYKSTAYVKGEEREIIVNDNVSGFNRRELHVESGITRTYRDENDNEITMSEVEFTNVINQAGQQSLAEYPRVQGFENEVDVMTQFVYNIDYFIGDRVTNRNDKLLMATHSRVVTAHETWSRSGYTLNLEFGTSIPTLINKLKREVKR